MSQDSMHGQWEQSPERYFDNPLPPVHIAGKRFVLTGVFAFGKRSDIEQQIKLLGGTVTKRPAKTGCYVVVGTLPTKDWMTNDAGRKLIDALQLRDNENCFVRIIGEDHFVEALLATRSKENLSPGDSNYPQPPIPWDELMPLWLEPLLASFPDIRLEWYPTKSYLVVHREGRKSQWLCRVHHDRSGMPGEMEVNGYEPVPMLFRRSLPDEILILLQRRLSDL